MELADELHYSPVRLASAHGPSRGNGGFEIANVSPDRIFAGGEALICTGCPAVSAEGDHPQATGNGRSREPGRAKRQLERWFSRRVYRESGVRRTNPGFWNPSRRVHRSDHDAVLRCLCLVATLSTPQ